MITEQELNLLIDLAKLVKKYGVETFEALEKSISSPETTQRLSHILMQVSTTSRKIPKIKGDTKSKQDHSIPKALMSLKGVDPEKYQIISYFHNNLLSKTVLPSLRDIKEFATDNGLPEVHAKSRQKAISPLISSLIKLPNDQIITKIQSLKNYRTSDRSLEGWSNLILNRQ